METCVVGCKLPHGLNVDLIVKKGDKKAGIPDDTQRIVLKGANSARIVGGHGITAGVPKEAFEAWLKSKSRMAFVQRGLVFVVGNTEAAKKEAANRRSERTGFEGVDPLKAKVEPAGDDEKSAQRKLAQLRAENPDRNRSVDELDAA